MIQWFVVVGYKVCFLCYTKFIINLTIPPFMKKQNIILLVAFILILFFNISSLVQKSITNDEHLHIAAGYSYLKFWDFRVNYEHPPLAKQLDAFPLLFMDVKFDPKSELWHQKTKWEFADAFLFDWNKNSDQLLFWGRIPTVLLSLLLAYFIFRFAKELFGLSAGYLALFLYVFSPNILAHSRLITTDFAVTCFIFISIYFAWRFFNQQTWKSVVFAGISLGLALLAKFTTIYLVFLFVVFTLLFVYLKMDKKFFTKQSYRLYLKLFVIFLIALFVVNLDYGFENPFSSQHKKEFSITMSSNPLIQNTIYYVSSILPIPESYIKGLDFVSKHSIKGHQSYLMGMHSKQGWWHYFIIAFLIKTPVATLLFLLLSILLFKRLKKETFNELFLIIPIIVFFTIFIFNHINIGLRHILPIYPFILVFISRISFLRTKPKWIFAIPLVILLLWYLVASLFIYPHYLAYFNEFVGGPNNGPKYLLDSNIDWGQDLKGLKNYVDENNVENLILGYWGKDRPTYRGIDYQQLDCNPINGRIAVSVNILYGLVPENEVCLSWLREYEPIDKIGYSIFVYDIKDVAVNTFDFEEVQCKAMCAASCNTRGQNYRDSFIKDGFCECICV